MVNKKTEHIFHSMSEIEKKYFPKSSQSIVAKKTTDAKALGIIMARSSLAKIKTILIN